MASGRVPIRVHLGSPQQVACLLVCGLAFWSCGCDGLVIEKTIEVAVIPPDSKEIRMYWVYEGVSLKGDINPDTAKKLLTSWQEWHTPSGADADPAWKDVRVGDLRFFCDITRERQLCADRRVTILDRDAVAQRMNEAITKKAQPMADRSAKENLTLLREYSTRLEELDKSWDPSHGLAALARATAKVDEDSINRIKECVTSKEVFRWVRFEPEQVRIVLPVTPDVAKRIAADPETTAWLKAHSVPFFAHSDIHPLRLEAGDEGLAIVLGAKGKPIRMTITDSDPYTASLEKVVIEAAGSPPPVTIDGREPSADELIELFIGDASKKAP